MSNPRTNHKQTLAELVRFACDPHLDAMTRSWVFDALRDLSGETFKDDAHEWRSWWTRRGGDSLDPTREQAHTLIASAWLQP